MSEVKRTRVAVTGGAGYIGKELINRLRVREGCEISVFDRVGASERKAADQHLVDLADSSVESISAKLVGTDVLFHLAAARTDWGLTYAEYERDNVTVTRKLIAAAKLAGVKRWVYYGTVGVYGSSAVPLDEESPFRPGSDYAITKAKAEEELLAAAKEEGWSLRIIRPSAVFSEGQPDNTNLYRLIEAIRRNRFVLIGDGSEIKTTSYLHNLVDATLWLYDDLASGGINAFNYVDEPKLTTREMVDVIRSELNCRLPLVRLPLAAVERPARVLDWIGNRIGRDLPITAARIRKFCTATSFDSSKIRKAGFSPQYSSREAIQRTVRGHLGEEQCHGSFKEEEGLQP